MKLLSRSIEKNGTVTLMPEEPEDMWHVYNLICVGDSVRGQAIRKVMVENATGTSSSSRVRTMLIITVENVNYDSETNELRVKGRTLVDNQYVKKNAYHTLDLEVNRVFSLRKAHWDSISLERLDSLCDPTKSSDLAAVVMQEGLAHVCLVKASITIVRGKIEVSIPRKRKGNTQQHDKAMDQFYDNIIDSLLKYVDLYGVKCILIASPGFVKDQFFTYLLEYDIKHKLKVFIENKDKFTLIHSSSGFKSALTEILQDPVVVAKISDTMAASEMKLIDLFFATLNCEPSRAFYGLAHCEKACEAQAIETLLVSDKWFRNSDPDVRQQYIRLVETVRESGACVKIFSSMHVSGEMLDKITGIAAILRFPMNELEEDEDSNDDEKKSDKEKPPLPSHN